MLAFLFFWNCLLGRLGWCSHWKEGSVAFNSSFVPAGCITSQKSTLFQVSEKINSSKPYCPSANHKYYLGSALRRHGNGRDELPVQGSAWGKAGIIPQVDPGCSCDVREHVFTCAQNAYVRGNYFLSTLNDMLISYRPAGNISPCHSKARLQISRSRGTHPVSRSFGTPFLNSVACYQYISGNPLSRFPTAIGGSKGFT